MQTGARYQAALEILTEVFKNQKPADSIINDYVRSRKYIGSKDRRFICDLVWNIIRNRLKLEFDAKSDDPRKILLWYHKNQLKDIFDGSQYGMSPLTAEEKTWLESSNEQPYPDYIEAECPQWLFEQISNIEFCKALNQPATADFRAHGHIRQDVIKRLNSEGIEVTPTPYAPNGFRSFERINVNNISSYQEGWFEVQDEASQIAALLCNIKPQHKIIDYCCGAGGKSLALSDIINNQGKILAHDISYKRLSAIKPRLERLGVKNIELTDIIADSDRDFDKFIIDAPCSGTGTWRRAPDAKYRLTPQMLRSLNQTQYDLLELAANKVKINGQIIYITCSVLTKENEDIINLFLSKHNNFSLNNIKDVWEQQIECPYPHHNQYMLRMSPQTTNTDGFFICILQKNSI
ncbi:MAG: RsmB/NOP family class I SAM-dependent RNA methyltransferase [Alphaproteobacteria bacterium]|nr:RsmB/NOP family class I SAM-dependent RNA methyltransferase [Alphaproteobacteria bacterium]